MLCPPSSPRTSLKRPNIVVLVISATWIIRHQWAPFQSSFVQSCPPYSSRKPSAYLGGWDVPSVSCVSYSSLLSSCWMSFRYIWVLITPRVAMLGSASFPHTVPFISVIFWYKKLIYVVVRLCHHRAEWYVICVSNITFSLIPQPQLGPSEQSVGQITQFQALFLSPGFLAYGSVLIAAALVIIFYFAPR